MKIDRQILPYLQANAQEALGVSDFTGATIDELPGGDYNKNFRVQQDNCDVVVRLNIEPQSGSADQIEHEYNTLKFLEPHGVTPNVFLLDNTRQHFPYGLLIEEYIPGGHVQFSVQSVRRVADAMAVLHTVKIDDAPLQRRDNPLGTQFESVMADLERYQRRNSPNADLIKLGGLALAGMKKDLPKLEGLYTTRSIIHTDPNPANIIDTGKKAYLIDWEQGRIDDPSYDVAAFFSDALNLWASPRVLTSEEKQAFLQTYTEKTQDTTIQDRVLPRLVLYTLNAAIWGASRIADVDEGKIDPHLGNQNYERYRRLADLGGIEKVLAMR